jgi:hypothetical protein
MCALLLAAYLGVALLSILASGRHYSAWRTFGEASLWLSVVAGLVGFSVATGRVVRGQFGLSALFWPVLVISLTLVPMIGLLVIGWLLGLP